MGFEAILKASQCDKLYVILDIMCNYKQFSNNTNSIHV